jgi:hypothetical protein
MPGGGVRSLKQGDSKSDILPVIPPGMLRRDRAS